MVRRLRPMLTAFLEEGPCHGEQMLLEALKPVILVHAPGSEKPVFYEYISLGSDGKSATYRHSPDY